MEQIFEETLEIDNDVLKDFILAIEAKRKLRKEINEEIKEIFDEAGSTGYDKKIMRKIITMREKDFAEIIQEEQMIDVYKKALGMYV